MSHTKYNAFISYRKTSSVNADFIRQSIADNSAYTKEDIFLDKHNIGPELFNEKIKKAIVDSKCLVLLVTEGCFKSKEDGKEDWFVEEIRTAISLGKRIIPFLFDDIDSLSEASLLSDLEKCFTEHEIEILTKSQSIPYSSVFPDASIQKLVEFIEKANETHDFIENAYYIMKGIGIVITILLLFLFFFGGIGAVLGYYTSSAKFETILADNTTIDGTCLRFEYDGCKATYDLNNDTILVNLEEFEKITKVNNVNLFLSSFKFTGIMFLIEKNISYLKYIKFLRGGSKPAKIAFACASAVACVGAFCGFSQGYHFGRTKRQEETALLLYQKLPQRYTWKPLIKNNNFLLQKYCYWEWAKAPNGIVIGLPNDSMCVAFKAGITNLMVLLKYNNWEIGRRKYFELLKEIENSRKIEKHLVLLNMQDLSVVGIRLPQGVDGFVIEPGDGNQRRYEIAVEKYDEWKYNNMLNPMDFD